MMGGTSDDEDVDDQLEEEDWTDTSWALPALHNYSHVLPGDGSKLKQLIANLKPDMAVKGEPSVVKRMLLNDNKAGMEGLDKEKINQIIHEASKGSRFYENERKKEEEMTRKIEEQKQKINMITEAQLKQGLLEADMLLEDFEQQRNLSRTIVHIDMDAFYAAVEMRDDPSLKDKPMAVGGTAMLSTSNYNARKFGVRAAMPGFIAKKLCPDLIIVSSNFDKYTAVSQQVKSLIAEYDPNFCPMSLDEAYLDITDHLNGRKESSATERTFICRNEQFHDLDDYCLCDLNVVLKEHGDRPLIIEEGRTMTIQTYFRDETCEKDVIEATELPQPRPCCPICGRQFPPFSCVTFGLSDEETVRELRTRIEQKTRLTASAGIAPNMMLSKVCSDKNKPNGQYKIPATRDAIMDFIKDLPTRKISGIGKVSEAMLNTIGVYTCTDLYDKRALLYHLYSPISFNYFMRICLGIGSTTVERDSERKSISTERTFQEISKPSDLFKKCEELTDALVEDLKTEQLKGKTVSIKIKTVKFDVKTRAHSLSNYTNDREMILQIAVDLLKTEILACSPQPLRLRLLGVRMSNLSNLSACKDGKKQGTIIGAFKKLAEKPKIADTSATDTQTVDKDIEEKNNINRVNMLSVGDVLSEKLPLNNNRSNECRIEEQNTVFVSVLDVFKGGDCEEVNNNKKATEQIDELCDQEPNSGNDGGSNHTNLQTLVSCDKVHNSTGYTDVMCCSSVPEDAIGIEDNHSGNKIHAKKVNTSTSDRIVTGVNVSNLAAVTAGIIKEQREGRTNRSGLVRSNKKPVRKRRNSKQSKTVKYNCPICTKEITCDSLKDFNEHVDECLEGNSCLKSYDTADNGAKEISNSHIEVNNISVDRMCDTEINCDSRVGKHLEKPLHEFEGSTDQNTNLQKSDIESRLQDNVIPMDSGLVVDEINDIDSDTAILSKTIIDTQVAKSIKAGDCINQSTKSGAIIDKCKTYTSTESRITTQTLTDKSLGKSELNSFCTDSVQSECTFPVKDNVSVCPDSNDLTDTKETKTEDIVNPLNNNLRCFSNHHEGVNTDDKFEIPSQPPLPSLNESSEIGSSLLLLDDGHSSLGETQNTFLLEQRVDQLEDNINKVTTISNADESLNDLKPGVIVSEKTVHASINDFVNDNTSPTNDQLSSEIKGNLSEKSSVIKDIPEKICQPQAGCSWMFDKIDDAVVAVADDMNEDTGEPTEVGLLVCPVCNVEQRSADLNEFNNHVDSCLSKGAISEILKEQRQMNGTTFKRDRDIMKTPGSIPPAKKRRTILPNKSPSCKTILSFFKDSQKVDVD